jgi:uncharacterized protein YndB with AHSA1/START domain
MKAEACAPVTVKPARRTPVTATKAKPSPAASIAAEEFVITRVVDAPLKRAWKAWTDPKQLKQWWGPKGFEIVSTKVDLKPGGIFHYRLRCPDGQDMWGKFVYREIVPEERLVFIVAFPTRREARTGTRCIRSGRSRLCPR